MEFSQELESIMNLEDESLVMSERTIDEPCELDNFTGILDEYVALFKETRKQHEARLHESKVQNAENHHKLDQELAALTKENTELQKQLALADEKLAQEKQKLVAASEKLSKANTLKGSLIEEVAALQARVDDARSKMGEPQDLKSVVNAYRFFTGVTWEPLNVERQGPTRGYFISGNEEQPELRLLEWNPEDPASCGKIWDTIQKTN